MISPKPTSERERLDRVEHLMRLGVDYPRIVRVCAQEWGCSENEIAKYISSSTRRPPPASELLERLEASGYVRRPTTASELLERLMRLGVDAEPQSRVSLTFDPTPGSAKRWQLQTASSTSYGDAADGGDLAEQLLAALGAHERDLLREASS